MQLNWLYFEFKKLYLKNTALLCNEIIFKFGTIYKNRLACINKQSIILDAGQRGQKHACNYIVY